MFSTVSQFNSLTIIFLSNPIESTHPLIHILFFSYAQLTLTKCNLTVSQVEPKHITTLHANTAAHHTAAHHTAAHHDHAVNIILRVMLVVRATGYIDTLYTCSCRSLHVY